MKTELRPLRRNQFPASNLGSDLYSAHHFCDGEINAFHLKRTGFEMEFDFDNITWNKPYFRVQIVFLQNYFFRKYDNSGGLKMK